MVAYSVRVQISVCAWSVVPLALDLFRLFAMGSKIASLLFRLDSLFVGSQASFRVVRVRRFAVVRPFDRPFSLSSFDSIVGSSIN